MIEKHQPTNPQTISVTLAATPSTFPTPTAAAGLPELPSALKAPQESAEAGTPGPPPRPGAPRQGGGDPRPRLRRRRPARAVPHGAGTLPAAPPRSHTRPLTLGASRGGQPALGPPRAAVPGGSRPGPDSPRTRPWGGEAGGRRKCTARRFRPRVLRAKRSGGPGAVRRQSGSGCARGVPCTVRVTGPAPRG